MSRSIFYGTVLRLRTLDFFASHLFRTSPHCKVLGFRHAASALMMGTGSAACRNQLLLLHLSKCFREAINFLPVAQMSAVNQALEPCVLPPEQGKTGRSCERHV